MELWGLGKSLGEELVRRCVEKGLVGVGMASLNWVQIQVHIGRLDQRETWERRQDSLKELLAGLEDPPGEDFDIVIHDRWSYAVYEV